MIYTCNYNTAATSFSTSQPTTEDGSRSQPTMEGGSSSTNIEIGVSTDSQLTIINIAASIGAVVIVLIVAMVVMVSLCLGFYMVSKRRKDQRQMESYASKIKSNQESLNSNVPLI